MPHLNLDLKWKYKNITFTEINKWLEKGFPVLCGDDYSYNVNHCVIISGYEDNRFYVIDPNTAKEYLIDKSHVIEHSDEFLVMYE